MIDRDRWMAKKLSPGHIPLLLRPYLSNNSDRNVLPRDVCQWSNNQSATVSDCKDESRHWTFFAALTEECSNLSVLLFLFFCFFLFLPFPLLLLLTSFLCPSQYPECSTTRLTQNLVERCWCLHPLGANVKKVDTFILNSFAKPTHPITYFLPLSSTWLVVRQNQPNKVLMNHYYRYWTALTPTRLNHA